jgi:hypothetical protein
MLSTGELGIERDGIQLSTTVYGKRTTTSDTDRLSIPAQNDDVGLSLPTVEEIRTNAAVNSSASISGKNEFSIVEIVFAGLLFFVLALISSRVALNEENKKNVGDANNLTCHSADPDVTIKNGTVVAVGVDRSSSFATIAEYLLLYNVSSETNLFEDALSFQHRTVLWLAYKDPMDLSVPDFGPESHDGYMFVFRYVMALNYLSLGGVGWISRMNFITNLPVCQWLSYSKDMTKSGVMCESSPAMPMSFMPESLYIGKVQPYAGID